MNLGQELEKASKSKWRLWLLNRIMWKVVPFNKPHKIIIVWNCRKFAEYDVAIPKNEFQSHKRHSCLCFGHIKRVHNRLKPLKSLKFKRLQANHENNKDGVFLSGKTKCNCYI